MIDHGGVVFRGMMADLLSRNSPTIRAAAEHESDTTRLIQLAADAGYRTARVNGDVEIEAPGQLAPTLNRLAWQAGINLRELQAIFSEVPGFPTCLAPTRPTEVRYY